MEILIILVVIIAAGLFFLGRKNKSRDNSSIEHSAYSYSKVSALLTPAERSFMGVLEQAIENTYRIQCKVRLADVILPIKGMNRSDWQKAFNRISSKHVDFLLVRPDSTEPVFAIELDDRSHETEKRIERDAFLDEALKSAGINLIRFSVKNGYTLQELREKLGLSNPVSVPTPIAPPPLKVSDTAAPQCPKCNAPMVKRQARSGQHAGKLFWACSRYPECKGIIAIPEENHLKP